LGKSIAPGRTLGISLASLVTPVVSMGNDSQKIRRSVTAIYCTMV